MKATQYNFNNKIVTVYYSGSLLACSGHQKITVEMECNGEYQQLSATTTLMPGFDAAQDLEGQEKYEALYELIETQIDDEVLAWVLELN